MSAIAASAADPSIRAIGDVLADLLSVKESILKVEREIDEVGKEIKTATEMLTTQLSAEDKTRWLDEKKRLGDKENNLRVEKNQYLVTKNALIAEKNRLSQPVSIPYTVPETAQIEAIEKELGKLTLLDTERAAILRNELVRLRKLHYSKPAHDTIAKLVFHSSAPRLKAEQDAFKFGVCERYPHRVQLIAGDRSNFLIRCMVTDCWLPQQECTAAHIFARQYRNLMREVVAVGPNVIKDDQNGMLWARGIETAFSRNEVCLMYNPLQQKLMFFVLNPHLLDEMICSSSNSVIKFKKVDGKPLDFDVSRLPSLRLLMLHAKNAISDARDMIDNEKWTRPTYWETLETLNSMMQDAAYRLCQDSDYASPEVFAQSAIRSENDENVVNLSGNVRSYSSPGDVVFQIPPPSKSASSGSQSSGRQFACEEFLTRIESRSYVPAAASSQSAVATGSNNTVVAPVAVAARASEPTRSSSFSSNLRPSPAQVAGPNTAPRSGTADLASAHPPLYSAVVSRGGLTTTPNVSSTASMAIRRVSPTSPAAPVVSGSSTQQSQAANKNKKPTKK